MTPNGKLSSSEDDSRKSPKKKKIYDSVPLSINSFWFVILQILVQNSQNFAFNHANT